LDQLTDNVIMLKVKAGDLDKMGLLFERHHRPLYGFLFHMTHQRESSEDMVQNVFYRMLRYRHTFNGSGEFATWMYHLARNVLKDHVKKNKTTAQAYNLDGLAEKIGGGPLPNEPIEKKQDWNTLHSAMTNLSPENREILVLSRFQGLKYNEIALIMEMTEGAVRVRIHRAIQSLKNIYLQIVN
jgi:RNA polymerase sigma factor (sigma-70 family)